MKDTVVAMGGGGSSPIHGGLGCGRSGSEPMQRFDSGATRNAEGDKFDYEGFLNPEALHAFGQYMHEHRRQRDGSLRDSDNWQKGIPLRVYAKSLVRHVIDLWRLERGYHVVNPDTGKPHTAEELCCAIVFNALGFLKETVDPALINQSSSALPCPEPVEDRKTAIDDAHRSFKCDSMGWCRQNGPRGWICNRPKGHQGRHVAVVNDRFLEEWR